MLILLPASEKKHQVAGGSRLDPAAMSFRSLAPTRTAVLEALVEASAAPDALRRLGVREGLADEVRANTALPTAPTADAGAVYAGVLFDALGLTDLDAAARRRADEWIVIISALWGAIRPDDPIPAYRLNLCGRLPRLGHLPQVWQPALSAVLPAETGDGLVVDLRTAEYLTAWRPQGDVAERTVRLKVVRDLDSGRGAGSHRSKRTGGLVVRRIVTDAIDPRRPEDLADALAPHFTVALGPARTLLVVESTV
jgi:cytoplasmic iron level regulating protein YaaA (DUF328/UPF0246 family)